MGLFTLPPAPPRADLELESFLKSDDRQTPDRRFRRTLAPEWFPQSGVQLTWPHESTDWAPMLAEVTETYVRLAFEIATREPLLIVAPDVEKVKALLAMRLPRRATENILYHACPTDDTWARDHGFLTVLSTGEPELHDFRFRGWGGKFAAENDDAINEHLFAADLFHGLRIAHPDFELEGGSIESDGLGHILTTSTCLMNPNRLRPAEGCTREEVEALFAEWFGAERVLWLEHGALAGDDTDSHVDTLARLCPDGKILYVRCLDATDEHYRELALMEEELRELRDVEGRPFELVPLPLPAAIRDESGERLPATYANYLVMNRAVLLPVYGQRDCDEQARRIVQTVFPKYDIVPIDCRTLIRQHGSLHCATMQFPRGVLRRE